MSYIDPRRKNRMANPVNYSIPLRTWVKVTTASTIATLYNKDIDYKYYQTYVDTGGAAPAAIVGNTIPDIAVPMFNKTSRELIASAAGIDIYVTCFRGDVGTGSGTVRVDS